MTTKLGGFSPEHQAALDKLTAEYEQAKAAGKWSSPLSPAQQARWQLKCESSIEGVYAPAPEVKYWSNGRGLYRVRGVEYAYLDGNGKWIEHPAVMDSVTGYKGACDTDEITESEARKLARKIAPRISIKKIFL